MTGQPERRRAAAALALALMIAGCDSHEITDARIDLASCRSSRLSDHDGNPVTGIENMAIVPETGALLLSAYDRRAVDDAIAGDAASLPAGGLYHIALAALAAGETEALRLPGPVQRPHGFALGGERGARRVHVIERRYVRDKDGWTLAPQLIEADLASDGMGLSNATVIDFPADICAPNDLAATPDGLFISNDHQRCTGMGRLIEDLFALSRSSLVHYADGDFRLRRAGLAYANGVAFDTGRRELLVAATRDNAIHVLPLEDDSPELPPLVLDASPDSLSLDWQGRLYVAAHPSLFSYAAFRGGWLGKKRAPSRVYRIIHAGSETEISLIFDDPDGVLISGATGVAASMTGTGNLLLISAGYDDRLVLCNLASGDSDG